MKKEEKAKESNEMHPNQTPLFIPAGRVTVQVVNFERTTRSGIEMKSLDPANRLVDAIVIAISPNAEAQGLSVGDYVVVPDTEGLVYRPNSHTTANPLTPYAIMHAMSIYIRWNEYPQDYYDRVAKADVAVIPIVLKNTDIVN